MFITNESVSLNPKREAHVGHKFPLAPPRRSWYAVVKIPLEFALALLLLVFSSPLILLAVLAIKLTSRGAAFYSQIRLGLGGRPYAIYKIRTMYQNCEISSGACWSAP